jgi:hypothetical protein
MVVNTENQQLRNHDPKRSQLDQEKHGLAQQVNEHQSTLSLGETTAGLPRAVSYRPAASGA